MARGRGTRAGRPKQYHPTRATYKRDMALLAALRSAPAKPKSSTILARNSKHILEKKSTLFYNGVSALPNAFSTRFRWSWVSQLATTTQGISAALGSGYRVNSIRDPDAGAGGHGPLFFNQLLGANLYTRYRVYKCIAQVIFTNPSRDDLVVGCRLRIGGSSAVTSGLGEDYLREQTRTTFKTIQTGCGNRVVFNLSLPIERVLGCKRAELMTDDEYAAGYGSDPATQIYLDPWAITRNAAVGSVDVSINMLYYTELDELVQPAQS